MPSLQSILLLGPPGTGKTTAACSAFPSAYRVGPSEEGFQVCETVLGIPSNSVKVPTIKGAIKVIEALMKKGDKSRVGLIVDDATLLFELSALYEYEQTVRDQAAAEKRKVNWYDYFELCKDDALSFLNTCWNSGTYNVMTAQFKEPERNTETGKVKQGGFVMPHGNSARAIEHGFSCIYEMTYLPSRIHHPAGFQVEGISNPLVHTKDRLNLVDRKGKTPANLAELLRFAGHPLRYPTVVAGGTLPAAEMEDIRKFAFDTELPWNELVTKGREKWPTLHRLVVKWALGDGVDWRTISQLNP